MAFFQFYYLITPQEPIFTAKQSLIALFLDIILCKLILDRLGSPRNKLISRFWFFVKQQLRLDVQVTVVVPVKAELDEDIISREDVEIAMEKLGLVSNPEGEQIRETMGSDQILELFDEKEPSLEEVKEAFEVFDSNGDGFVDEVELQRVMVALGLKEGFGVERCREMIRVVDENGDGKVEFGEFVKLMENSFC
ncbi:Probable calcium-binding protein CML46 [Linum grandiflorum]